MLVTASAAANAQSTTREKTPGDQMQDKGSVKGSPGASGYAPGHLMQEKGSVKGTTGASGYAPGHETTGADVKGGASIDAGKAGAKTDIDAGAKVSK
ncbi:MAG: hypothetical protein HY244_10825 [Rhizobiales bacterium]|nr:hypothetical protein [Hyphomicrobiales bacterium]